MSSNYVLISGVIQKPRPDIALPDKHRNQRVLIIPALLTAPEIIITTTSGATSDDKVGIMTTFDFNEWHFNGSRSSPDNDTYSSSYAFAPMLSYQFTQAITVNSKIPPYLFVRSVISRFRCLFFPEFGDKFPGLYIIITCTVYIVWLL